MFLALGTSLKILDLICYRSLYSKLEQSAKTFQALWLVVLLVFCACPLVCWSIFCKSILYGWVCKFNMVENGFCLSCTPLGKSSRTFFRTCQIFKFIFWDCYKYVAFCNMNCIKQFISFWNFGVNPLRFSGHWGRAWVQKLDVHLAKQLGTTHLKIKG